jgi:hypothetical protein
VLFRRDIVLTPRPDSFSIPRASTMIAAEMASAAISLSMCLVCALPAQRAAAGTGMDSSIWQMRTISNRPVELLLAPREQRLEECRDGERSIDAATEAVVPAVLLPARSLESG